MTDTTIFDTGEKVDVLLKAAFGFPSASEKRAWYEETAVKYNTYVNGEDVLVETIPPIPDFDNNGIVRTAEELGLSTSDFYNYSIDETSKSTCSIVDDSSGIVRRIRHIILEETPQLGTDAGASWYKLDSSGNNVLIDSFQFNFKQYTSGGVVYSPYGYSVTTESAVSDGSLLPGGKKGGNWFIDIRSGLLFFPDFNNFSNGTQTDSKFQVNTSNNKPILTIYKYIGKKGVANLTTSGGSVGSSSSTVTGENIIKLESITTINRMGNEDTLVYNVEDSGELSKLGSDLVSIGAKQEVLYNLDGTVSTSDKGYKWTSIHLYKDASGNYYLNGTNFSDTVENQIQHIKIDEILKKNYLLDDTKISSLFDSESLDVVGFATVTMNGTKRLGDLKKQWNAYNNDWLKITGNGLSYATMREGRHGCAYSFSSSNGMVIDTEFVDDDLRVMIGVYMENKNKNYSTISKLHAKVATLETELAAIKQHLGI